MNPAKRSDAWVPAMLLALSLVPMLGGVARLHHLSSSTLPPPDARFAASAGPLVIHIVAASIYAVVGAFQFSAGFRRRWARWHRRTGALALGCGLVAAVTGMWMAAWYPIPASLQGPVLRWMRLFVGAAMVGSLVKASTSIWQRRIAQHEAWMIRAYALAQGAGTQAILFLPVMLVTGPLLGRPRDILMTVAWLLNVTVAEWLIRRRPRRVRPSQAAVTRSSVSV